MAYFHLFSQFNLIFKYSKVIGVLKILKVEILDSRNF